MRNILNEFQKDLIIAHKFIFNSIPLYLILCLCLETYPQFRKSQVQEKVVGFELISIAYENLMGVYKNLYPKMWQYIEKESTSAMEDFISTYEAENDCDHAWTKTYVVKKGDFYVCKKCSATANKLPKEDPQ